MALASPEATIEFLLTCLESADGCDFEAVTKEFGHYKAAKYARQALANIKKKYRNDGKPLAMKKIKGREKAAVTEKKQGGGKHKTEGGAAVKEGGNKRNKADGDREVDDDVKSEERSDGDADELAGAEDA